MDKLLEVLLPYLMQVGVILGGVALVYIAKLVKDYLEQKVGHEKLDEVLKQAKVVVQWAEQTLKDAPGFEKKEVAMVALRAIAEAIDYYLTDAELDKIIEAQVFEMNKDLWPEPEIA